MTRATLSHFRHDLAARALRIFHRHTWVYGATTWTAYRICQTCSKRQIEVGLLGWENVPSKCDHCHGSGRYLDADCRPGPCSLCAGSGTRDLLAESLARDAAAMAGLRASSNITAEPASYPPPTYTLINPAGADAANPPRPVAHKPTTTRR